MSSPAASRRSWPDLAGKVALVTGTTSGFGQRFAQVLVQCGASVALTGRRVERLEELEGKLKDQGGNTVAVALDVTDPESVARAADQTEEALGPIDILVNNAGLNVNKKAVDLTVDDYDLIMDTNTRGMFLMAQAAGRKMIARGNGGQIVNIASMGAHKVLPGLAVYCMSKAAVVMMTKALAREWARYDINVNALCPGFIRTEINDKWFETESGRKQIEGFPRRRIGEAEDLDEAFLLLASGQSRLLTGASIEIDDAQSI